LAGLLSKPLKYITLFLKKQFFLKNSKKNAEIFGFFAKKQ